MVSIVDLRDFVRGKNRVQRHPVRRLPGRLRKRLGVPWWRGGLGWRFTPVRETRGEGLLLGLTHGHLLNRRRRSGGAGRSPGSACGSAQNPPIVCRWLAYSDPPIVGGACISDLV